MRSITKITLAICIVTGVCLAAAWAGEEEKITVDQLPAKVTAAISAKYPGAKVVGAEKEVDEGKTLFEVAIEDKGSKAEISLDAEGTIVEIERQITDKDLPEAVRKSFHADYPGGELKKIEEITVGDSISYEVLVVTTTEVKYDTHGAVVEKEQKSGKED
jgi:uncharacterized cupredoxin-like copper-binding protein